MSMHDAPIDVAVAVDIGGTKVDAALVDARGRIVPGSRHRAPTGPGQTPETFTAAIASVCRPAMDAAGPAHRVIGIGVGTAGPLLGDGTRISPLNLPGIREFPLTPAVEAAQGRLPPESARGRLRHLATSAPLAPEPLLVHGAIALKEGQTQRAERLLVEARRLSPWSAAARFLLADVWLNQGRIEDGLGEMAALSLLIPGSSVQLAPALAQ